MLRLRPSTAEQVELAAYGDDRKFFCRYGTREFHTHPQHADQPWDAFRPLHRLEQIVIELMRDMRGRFYFG